MALCALVSCGASNRQCITHLPAAYLYLLVGEKKQEKLSDILLKLAPSFPQLQREEAIYEKKMSGKDDWGIARQWCVEDEQVGEWKEQKTFLLFAPLFLPSNYP